ncbi:MAG: gamma-glutamyl-phosphate reductase, partial [Kangiella sp.]|nr:gamma-glutamyl-phosphate reductase [Kangiella sp.]
MTMKENTFESKEQQELYELTVRAKQAARTLGNLTSSQKNDVLAAMAKQLKANQDQILEANKKDIQYAKDNDLSDAMVDRLLLDEARVDGMVDALHNVMSLADPVGEMGPSTLRPNGIRVGKMRIPL